MATVVTNIALVLKGLIDTAKTNHITGNDLHAVYDHSMAYESAIGRFRSKNKILDQENRPEPLFIFNRNVMEPREGLGRRTSSIQALDVDTENLTADVYKVVQGSVDVRFMFVSTDMRETEAFEIGYIGGEGIKSIKSYTVSLPGGLGDWDYFVSWGQLDQIEVESERTYHKAVSGSARVDGAYFILKSEDSPIIEQINTTIQTFQEEVLLTQTIT